MPDNCINAGGAGGDYVVLVQKPKTFPDPSLEAKQLPVCKMDQEMSSSETPECGMENLLRAESLRVSLYRNKIAKVDRNPFQPLTNPYRVSEHDQMPIKVIPSPMCKRTSPKVMTPAKVFPVRKVKWGNVSAMTRDQGLTPKSKAASVDNLTMTSFSHCYVTRSSLKRVTEESNFDKSSLSALSNDSDRIPELTQTLMRNKLRSSRNRKSRQRFNFGIFSRNTRCKSRSEYALNETKEREFIDSPKRKKKDLIVIDDAASEQKDTQEERSFSRNKRRLSGFRLRIQKKFGPKEEKPELDSTNVSQIVVSPRKRRSEVISNPNCEADDFEANNNREAVSLMDVLRNKELCEEFRQFLSSELSDENLDFWTMCEKFKTSSDRSNLAEVIFRQFIRREAPREVNLDAETKSTLKVNIRCPSPTSFVSAQDSIYRLMEKDSFRRFCALRSKRMKMK